MDPICAVIPALVMRLPRTRGDGPVEGLAADEYRAAPPHARGWTSSMHLEEATSSGSPARAGMDRGRRAALRAVHRLPRTRGDGPGPYALTAWNGTAPPHARGWTWGLPARKKIVPGSPARAGMDRPCPETRTEPCRLPRTRGDGPPRLTDYVFEALAPPHARGWTRPGSGCL